MQGADTSPPRPWEQLGKFSGSREAAEEARKCDATPLPRTQSSRPVQPQTMEARFHSHSRLLGAAAGPPGSGPRRQPRVGWLCGAPSPLPAPESPTPPPHPPISRSAGPARPRCGAPSPVPDPGRRRAVEEGVSATRPERERDGGVRIGDRGRRGPRAPRRDNGGWTAAAAGGSAGSETRREGKKGGRAGPD